jgi:ribosomal protein S20
MAKKKNQEQAAKRAQKHVSGNKLTKSEVKTLEKEGFSSKEINSVASTMKVGDKAQSRIDNKHAPAAKKSTPAAKSSVPSGSSYNAIGAWGQANQGNPTVQAAANDLFYNAAAADLSTRSAVSYANQMMPIALRYQQASTNIAEATDLRRLGAETSAARGLLQQQGDIGYRDNRLAAQTHRYGYDTQLKGIGLQADAQRYGYDQQLKGVGLQEAGATQRTQIQDIGETRRVGLQTDAQRYGYDQQLRGVGLQTDAQRYESSQATARTGMETEAQRYGYDQQLRGVGLQTEAQRYGYDQQLRGVGLQTEAQRYGYDQQLRGLGCRPMPSALSRVRRLHALGWKLMPSATATTSSSRGLGCRPMPSALSRARPPSARA